jgi:hypothetical protein
VTLELNYNGLRVRNRKAFSSVEHEVYGTLLAFTVWYSGECPEIFVLLFSIPMATSQWDTDL